jgi:hypothetical protein
MNEGYICSHACGTCVPPLVTSCHYKTCLLHNRSTLQESSRYRCVAAQLGFFGILLVEALAGKGVFELVGISVGNGLGFEF